LAAKLTEEVSRLTTDKEELQGQLEESKKALNQYLQQAAASDALAARLTEEVRWLTADRKELLCQIDLARYFFKNILFQPTRVPVHPPTAP
jgi:chromosome segregation ATPase